MYSLFKRRRDALFDLTDALLTSGPLLSPAHLSLVASFQRGWGSVYDALVDGRIEAEAVEELLAGYGYLPIGTVLWHLFVVASFVTRLHTLWAFSSAS